MRKKSIISTLCVVLVSVIALLSFPISAGASEVVTDLQIEPITVIEGTYGYTDYNDDFFKYTFEDKLNYTVTFDDGELSFIEYLRYFVDEVIEYTVTYKNGEVVSGVGTSDDIKITILDDQSYDNQWTAGNTYTVAAYFDGYKTTFDVTIVENPV